MALKMALSSRLASGGLLVVREISLPEVKTRHFVKIAGALGLDKALIITPEGDEALFRAARNIPGISVSTPDKLSVLEILSHRQLVLLEKAVKPVEARFSVKEA